MLNEMYGEEGKGDNELDLNPWLNVPSSMALQPLLHPMDSPSSWHSRAYRRANRLRNKFPLFTPMSSVYVSVSSY